MFRTDADFFSGDAKLTIRYTKIKQVSISGYYEDQGGRLIEPGEEALAAEDTENGRGRSESRYTTETLSEAKATAEAEANSQAIMAIKAIF